MRISVNLATRPFVELRPLFARLRLAMAALALVAIALGIGLHIMTQRAKVNQAQMDDLKAQTLKLQQERQSNEARMKQPANQAVLERSQFLNDLFARKSFSWTSVMMDLERVLPAGVQVTSIEPVVTTSGGVNIRMRVTGPRELAVELVRNLERSQRFVSPRLANETAQTPDQGKLMPVSVVPGGVEFDILSGYNPLPSEPKQDAAKDGDAAKTASASPAAVMAMVKRAGPAKTGPAKAGAPAKKPAVKVTKPLKPGVGR